MTVEEYELAKSMWMSKEYTKDINRPTGLSNNWTWYLKKEREFKKLIEHNRY